MVCKEVHTKVKHMLKGINDNERHPLALVSLKKAGNPLDLANQHTARV